MVTALNLLILLEYYMYAYNSVSVFMGTGVCGLNFEGKTVR